MSAAPDLGQPSFEGDGDRPWSRQVLRRAMRAAARAMSAGPEGENPLAVRLFDRLDRTRTLIGSLAAGRRGGSDRAGLPWPVVAGDYQLGDRDGCVAICTLSSPDLIPALAKLPGVAIAGRLYTVNSGIERMLLNLHANPRIRYLLLCGKDSPIFQTAQGLRALWRHGVTAEHRIPEALGHFPVLKQVPLTTIDEVRRRVELIDLNGVKEPAAIADWLRQIERDIDSVPKDYLIRPSTLGADASVAEIRTHRVPSDDRCASGFFIVQANHEDGLILCQQYSSGHSLLGEERANSASRIVRSLIKKGALDDPGHAAYLGGELAKAEAALRLHLRYEQDQPLRKGEADSA